MATKYTKTFNTDGTVTEYGPQGYTTSVYVPPDSGGLFGSLSNAFSSIDPSTAISRELTNLYQPVEKTISTNLAQLDKDLSLSQNAPLIATIAASIALPGVGASIGQSLLSAGLLPVGTSAAVATAVGSGLANAALQVAQGKSPEEALKAGVVGAAGGAIGDYLIGDPGTVKSFVTSTSTNLLAGKNPEDAVKAGIVSSGAGLAGSTVAGETGSNVAGQVAAGTTAGLLTGKTGEQALAQGVGNINLGSISLDNRFSESIDKGKSGDLLGQVNQMREVVGLNPYKSLDEYYAAETTVPTESQAVVSQQELQGTLSPFEAGTPADTTKSGFDVNQDISDTSGFTAVTSTTPIVNQTQEAGVSTITPAETTPTTSITEDTGGTKMPDYTEDPYGYSGDSTSNVADPYALLDPVTGEYNVGADDQNYDPYTATLSDAAKEFSKTSGLSVDKVLKFFKDNPTIAKSLAGAITGGVSLFGTKLAKDAADAAAKAAAEAMKFKPVGVTTRFGATNYTYDDKGNLATAGYTLTPELKAIQDKLMSGATLSLDEAKKVADLYDPLKKASASLFDLGTSYLAKTPEQVASDYMAKQQDLLAPSRERQLSQLQNTLFQQGRGGLSVGATSARPSGARGLGATTPEMEAYYNALAQQDAALAAGAQQAGQQSVLFGKGLLGAGGEFLGKYTAGQTSAYDPFKSLLSTAGTVEGMGGGALDIGTALGGRTTTASTTAARTLMPTASVNPYSSLFTSLADDPQFKAAVQSYISGGPKP